MENPSKQIQRGALIFFFGLAVGLIPGGIKLDQMRRQADADRADWTKLNDGLRAAIADQKDKNDADRAACQRLVTSDEGYTVLMDMNHPYGNLSPEMAVLQVMNVNLILPPVHPVRPPLQVGPMWVIPRIITPHVVDGVLGAAYTHIWPNGKTEQWQFAGRAE